MTDLKYAIDVNSDWGTDRLRAAIQRHQPDHVILHAYHKYERASAAAVMRLQPAVVQSEGKTAGYYMWGFQGYDPVRSVEESVELFRESAGHEVPVGWVDCETYPGGSDPGPDVDWMHKAGEAYNRLGIRKGIYASPFWIQERWGNRASELSDWLADWKLWLAHWNGIPRLESSFMPLYGWTEMAAHQWAVDIPGDESIDRDVILAEYTVPAVVPEPEPTDELSELKRKLEGMRILADDVAWQRLGNNIAAMKITRDVLMEAVNALDANIAEADASRNEMRRIRVEFLGEP